MVDHKTTIDKPSCSLCKSQRLVNIKTIAVEEINRFYKNRFKLDVSGFFPEKRFSVYLCAECGVKTHHPAIPGDSGFYDHMQKFDFYYEEDKPEFEYAIQTLVRTRPDSVLEVGCGEGKFLDKIKHAFSVSASELSENSISKLREKGIELDEGDKKYDFCTSFQVLEHVPDAFSFVENIINKLNDGGHLLISVPNNDSKYYKERFGVLDYPPHHMTQWSRNALESISKLFPLDVVDYYEEPHRIEHYAGLIKARRDTVLPKSGIRVKISKALSMVLDPVLMPYYIDNIHYPGMTHAMLYRKK